MSGSEFCHYNKIDKSNYNQKSHMFLNDKNNTIFIDGRDCDQDHNGSQNSTPIFQQ